MLCGSPYFKGVFHHKAVADPDAPVITNHHEAFLVLVGCLRAVDAAGGKNFHLTPLVGPGRRFLFLDRLQLQYTYTQHTELREAGHTMPTCVADVVMVATPRKGYELGASVRTDGVQLVARWEKEGTKTLTMGLKAHAAWLLRHEDKTQLRADYADQQRRLANGEKLFFLRKNFCGAKTRFFAKQKIFPVGKKGEQRIDGFFYEKFFAEFSLRENWGAAPTPTRILALPKF